MGEDLDPHMLLELNLAELNVRSEVVLDLLSLAIGALAEVGFRAARAGEDEIVEHVSATLETIHGKIGGLVP